MGYSSEEIREVVEQIVTSVIRRPVDVLGRRGLETTFSDIQEAAAGVLLLYPLSPFYISELGSQRLTEEVRSLAAVIDDLLVALGVLKRHVLPVRDVSSLKNAKAALFELETLSSGGAVTDLTTTSAYTRFNTNVDRFLAQAGAVKQNGDIVPTPQEARLTIPGYMASFKEGMESLVAKATYLRDSMDDFSSTKLPSLVAASVMSKTRKIVDARATELDAMGEDARMEVLRETVLELLASKAAVRVFSKMPSLESALSISGTGVPFADTDRPAISATLMGDKPGPYNVLVWDGSYELKVWLDGNTWPADADESMFLPESYWARIEGQITETFSIQAGYNDALRLFVSDHVFGDTYVTVPFIAGAARTAQQICDDINLAMDLQFGPALSAFIAEPYLAPTKFRGQAYADTAGSYEYPLADPPTNGTFPIDPSTGSSYLSIGDLIHCIDSPFGNNGAEVFITGFDPSAANPKRLLVAPAILNPASSLLFDLVEVGPALRRVRLVPRDHLISVQNRHSIQIAPNSDLHRNTGTALGFYGSLTSTSKPTHASILADFITKNSSKIAGSAVLVPVLSNIQTRTDPVLVNRLVAFYFRGTASYPTGGPGVVTFTLDDPPAAGVLDVGQTVILRGGYNPDTLGVITNVGTTTIDVNVSSAITVASSVLIEVGPTVPVPVGYAVIVADGANAGRYYVNKLGVAPFEFDIEGVPPAYSDTFGQPEFFRSNIGPEHLAISSKDTSTASSVYMQTNLIMTVPATATGTTRYLQLPEVPRSMEEGNLIEYYTTYNQPALVAEVETIYTDGVVKLDLVISSVVNWYFSATSPPFARARIHRVIDFETFETKLSTWLSLPDMNVSLYFNDLNRLINPLLVNKNPPGFAVAEAEQRVVDVYSLLTRDAAMEYGGSVVATLEDILESYQVDPVDEVDALVRTFIEKGADRAIGILLEGRFSDFFGLTMEETSYAGDFQKKMREVAREDLPVSKLRRYDQRVGRLEASIESPDYEYDSSDLDPSTNPDVPVDQG